MTWHNVGSIAEIPEGTMKRIVIATTDITIAHSMGHFYAFDDTCTHAEVSLAEGTLEGHQVECCAHGARFDIRTGEVKRLPATEPLTTYPVKQEGETLYVELRS